MAMGSRTHYTLQKHVCGHITVASALAPGMLQGTERVAQQGRIICGSFTLLSSHFLMVYGKEIAIAELHFGCAVQLNKTKAWRAGTKAAPLYQTGLISIAARSSSTLMSLILALIEPRLAAFDAALFLTLSFINTQHLYIPVRA